jgi:hypothetical protein
MGVSNLARISQCPTGEARCKPAMTSLGLLAVFDTGVGVARYAPTPRGRFTA